MPQGRGDREQTKTRFDRRRSSEAQNKGLALAAQSVKQRSRRGRIEEPVKDQEPKSGGSGCARYRAHERDTTAAGEREGGTTEQAVSKPYRDRRPHCKQPFPKLQALMDSPTARRMAPPKVRAVTAH
jgi:hypothetical protein